MNELPFLVKTKLKFTLMEVIFYWVIWVRVFPWRALTSLPVWRVKWCHLVSEVEVTLKEQPGIRAAQSPELSDDGSHRAPFVLVNYDHPANEKKCRQFTMTCLIRPSRKTE